MKILKEILFYIFWEIMVIVFFMIGIALMTINILTFRRLEKWFGVDINS